MRRRYCMHTYFIFSFENLLHTEAKLPYNEPQYNFCRSCSPTTHLSVAHQSGVLPHQYVGTKEEDEGVAEAQQRPVQERSEGQQGVLADVPEGHKWFIFIS